MVKIFDFFVSGQTCGQTKDLTNIRQSGVPKKSVFSRAFGTFRKIYAENGDGVPNAARYQLRYASIFSFLSIFVSGQTCGQATYFERFVEKYTARIVSVVKGFRGSKKSTKESPCGCPERCALPAALRLEFFCLIFLFEATGRLAVPKRRYARAPPRQVATNCATPRYSPFRYALQNVLDRKRIYYSKYGADCQIFLLPSGKYLENYFKRGRA